MEQRKVDFAVNVHRQKDRPKSAFLTWILNNTSAPATDRKNDEDKNGNNEDGSEKLEIRSRDQHMMNSSYSTPTAVGSYTQLNHTPPPPPPFHKVNYTTVKGPNIVIENPSCDNKKEVDIQIPDRRQSNLYTPFHNNYPLSDDTYKRRSYYVSNLAPIDASISNSSLSRSATWQPSSSSNANNSNTPGGSNNQYLSPQTDIPTRRTSRNYADNPEIQAKLDAMLNSDRALLLSTVLNSNTDSSTNNSNSAIIYRRSTTPGNRLL